MVRSRSAVLAAALELLRERGVGGTTIEAVAARSGVAKTTIYRQWAGLPALVLDAFSTLLVTPAAPDTGALRDDLLQLLVGLSDALTTGPAGELMPALIDAAERDPEYARLHEAEARDRHGAVRVALARGVERGELPADADVDAAVDLLAGPLFHRRWFSAVPLDAAFAAVVVDSVLRGLGACSRP
jgi:AcrR family transcriptional regulator